MWCVIGITFTCSLGLFLLCSLIHQIYRVFQAVNFIHKEFRHTTYYPEYQSTFFSVTNSPIIESLVKKSR